MENQFQQLRFNISEKVRLQPQQAGIRTLLELDLYPDVEIKDEGQHLKIHGYLRLHGHYLGDELEYTDGQEGANTLQSEKIAYVIPVEITLPADKAAIDYIEAEIESFDYQIKSAFELQIDAVLMIDGILPEETAPIPAVAEESYEIPEESYDSEQVARYELLYGENDFSYDPQQQVEIRAEEESLSSETKNEQQEIPTIEKKTKTEESAPDAQTITEPKKEEKELPLEESNIEKSIAPTVEKAVKVGEIDPDPQTIAEQTKEENELPLKEGKTEESISPTAEKAVKVEEIDPDAPTNEESNPAEEETVFFPELKIEIGKQQTDKEQELEEVTQDRELDQASDQASEEEEESEKSSNTANQWYGWLIRQEEEESFTPMRMVIVQQEETIDTLASRYKVSANVLIEMNHLTTDRLERGQIIKIPGTKRAG